MLIVQTYGLYLAISIGLTIWVERTLFKNGKVFLVEVFKGDEALANSVNHLLVVGFYLLNLGFVALNLAIDSPPRRYSHACTLAPQSRQDDIMIWHCGLLFVPKNAHISLTRF